MSWLVSAVFFITDVVVNKEFIKRENNSGSPLVVDFVDFSKEATWCDRAQLPKWQSAEGHQRRIEA
jgi:hypothetical protein